MASRAELVQICIELEIDWHKKTIDELKDEIREVADKKFNKRYNISGDKLSTTLRKFLSQEYDYKFYKRDGTEVDHKGEEIK